MSEADRAMRRRNAEECVDLARIITDPEARQLLLIRAQAWLKLAYSEGDTEFERVLSAFNREQIALGAQIRSPIQRMAIRQQPRLQQSKSKPDDNGSSPS